LQGVDSVTLIHDAMLEAYQKGEVDDIRSFDFKFNKWVWDSIKRVVPLDMITSPIDVGITKDGSFWHTQYHSGQYVRFIGYKLGSDRMGINREWEKPIHMLVKIDPSDFVFCIDQLNDVSNEDKLKNILQNLMTYSTKYIFLSAWAYDLGIPIDVVCRKRYFWDIGEYLDIFAEKKFKLVAKAVNDDAINILYIFRKGS
jgi:hypothetical protein